MMRTSFSIEQPRDIDEAGEDAMTLGSRHRQVRGVAVVTALGFLAVFVGASLWAQTSGNTYTGCLANGSITNVNIGTSPLKPCGNRATPIQWNEVGPQGVQGIPGAPGGHAFWSGATSEFFDQTNSSGSLAETGPLPAAWYSIVGELNASSANELPAEIHCGLFLSSPEQGEGGDYNDGKQIATIVDRFTEIAPGTAIAVPIHLLVDNQLDNTQVLNIQCGVDPSVTVQADLLVIPTDQGQIGLSVPLP